MNANSKIDRDAVSISTEVERLYWTTKLGADESDVKVALQEVGRAPEAVAAWLRDAHRCHLRPDDEPRRPLGH